MNDISSASSSSAAPQQSESASGYKIINGDIKIETMDDLKKVIIEKPNGTQTTLFNEVMDGLAMKVTKDLQKQEEHRKKTVKDQKES